MSIPSARMIFDFIKNSYDITVLCHRKHINENQKYITTFYGMLTVSSHLNDFFPPLNYTVLFKQNASKIQSFKYCHKQ